MTETATLGGGCFWCLEAVFEQVAGVSRTESGYTGGLTNNPTYRDVCSGSTGHAEVVQVDFDPETVPYRAILEIFFGIHDPTTLNRQGADVGSQYRSAIFHHDESQAATARDLVDELTRDDTFGAPIVTEIVPLETFYPAEDYHREYYRSNPEQSYCQAVISPKVSKFRERFANRLAGD